MSNQNQLNTGIDAQLLLSKVATHGFHAGDEDYGLQTHGEVDEILSSDKELMPQGAQGPIERRKAPVMHTLASFSGIPGKIASVVPPLDATMQQAIEAERANNEISAFNEDIKRRRNSVSARRVKQRRENLIMRLAEQRSQAVAERNFWKARAVALGASQRTWSGVPEIIRDNYVADFRKDPKELGVTPGEEKPAEEEEEVDNEHEEVDLN